MGHLYSVIKRSWSILGIFDAPSGLALSVLLPASSAQGKRSSSCLLSMGKHQWLPEPGLRGERERSRAVLIVTREKEEQQPARPSIV